MQVGINAFAEALLAALKAQSESTDPSVELLGDAASAGTIERVKPWQEGRPAESRTLYVCEVAITLPQLALVVLGEHDEPPAVADGSALLAVRAQVSTLEALMLCLDVLHAFDAWDRDMLEAMATRQPTQRLLQVAVEMLANPVALFDSSTALIGYAGTLPPNYEDTIWGAVVTRGFAPLSYYAVGEREAVGRQLMETRDPVVAYPRREKGRAHVTVMINVEGSPYAMLSQVDLVAPFSPGQLEILSHVRDRLEQVAQVMVGSNRHAVPIEHCLRLLLEQSHVEESTARFHLAERGWHLEDAYDLVSGVANEELNEVSGRSLRDRVRAALPNALVILHEGAVVALVHADEKPLALKGLESVGKEYNISFGVGSRFCGFMRARTAYVQALTAIGLSGGAACVAHYDELFPAHVAELLRGSISEDVLCHPKLLELVRSSDPHADDYLRTLYVFLASGCNVTKAAKRLYVHRNTLEYRLGRMGERLGIELSDVDEEEQLRLMLSCLLLGR